MVVDKIKKIHITTFIILILMTFLTNSVRGEIFKQMGLKIFKEKIVFNIAFVIFITIVAPLHDLIFG